MALFVGSLALAREEAVLRHLETTSVGSFSGLAQEVRLFQEWITRNSSVHINGKEKGQLENSFMYRFVAPNTRGNPALLCVRNAKIIVEEAWKAYGQRSDSDKGPRFRILIGVGTGANSTAIGFSSGFGSRDE